MIVKLLSETGYDVATKAMRLSRQSTSDTVSSEAWDIGRNDYKLILKLLDSDRLESGDPHSVALRMVHLTFKITAPLYWWKQMDRYSVGKTQASESTMYTIMNRELSCEDFSYRVDSRIIEILNDHIRANEFEYVIENLPCGYLQTRIVQFSLPTLRRILKQREGHKLAEWREFVSEAKRQTMQPDLLK